MKSEHNGLYLNGVRERGRIMTVMTAYNDQKGTEDDSHYLTIDWRSFKERNKSV